MLTILSIIPLIIVVIAIQTDSIFDSPMYLMKAFDNSRALAIYKELYKPQYIEEIFEEKKIEMKRFYFNQLRMMFKRKQNSFLKRKDILIGIHLPILRRLTGGLVILLFSGSMIGSIYPQF